MPLQGQLRSCWLREPGGRGRDDRPVSPRHQGQGRGWGIPGALPLPILGSPTLSGEAEGGWRAFMGEQKLGSSQLSVTSLCFRDLVSLGISSAEHREALLSGISALQARVLQLQGQGVQV